MVLVEGVACAEGEGERAGLEGTLRNERVTKPN